MTESHTQGADVGQGGGLVLVLMATRSNGDCVEQTGRTPTRTSTRPPHPLHPAPCPYRTPFGCQHSSGNSLCLPLRRLLRLQRHPQPRIAQVMELVNSYLMT